MMEPPKMIDRTQSKLIHIALHQLGWSDAQYRDFLEKYFWVKSSKEMTYAEASKLIDILKDRGFKIKKAVDSQPRRRSLPPDVPQLPSRQQMTMIDHLVADIRWIVKPDGYQRWLNKFLGGGHTPPNPPLGKGGSEAGGVRITTARQAGKVIEALKAMRARQQRSAERDADDGLQMHDLPAGGGGRYVW